MSEYDHLANSGIMRTIEDYAMGINFSQCYVRKIRQVIKRCSGNQKLYGDRGRACHDLCTWNGRDPRAGDPKF